MNRCEVCFILATVVIIISDLVIGFVWYQPMQQNAASTICVVSDCISITEPYVCNSRDRICQDFQARFTTLDTVDHHQRSSVFVFKAQQLNYCGYGNGYNTCYYLLDDVNTVYDENPYDTPRTLALILLILLSIIGFIFLGVSCCNINDRLSNQQQPC